MNKVFTLLLALLLFYWSIKPLVNLFFKKRKKRREYRLNLSKKFEHLFSAVLLAAVPLLIIINYYQLMPSTAKMIITVLGSISLMCALISFYLYYNHLNKIPYRALIYDPNQLTIELIKETRTELIPFRSISEIKWYSVKNGWNRMTWGNFEYIELELRNGNRVIIPSLIIAPSELNNLLREFNVIPVKKLIARIK